MRKIKLFLVAVLTAISVQKAEAMNVGDFFTVDEITYQITSIDPSNFTVNVHSFTKTGAVTIPAEVRDSVNNVFKVTKMYTDGSRFDVTLGSQVTSISFEEGILELSGSSLSRFANLTSVYVPKSVKLIDNFFWATPSLQTITVASGNARYKSGSDGCLYTIAGDTLLKHPSGRTSTSYSVPSTVKVIMRNALHNCPKLTAVNIPASVETIQNEAIWHCSNIASYVVDAGNPNYSSSNGMLLSKSGDVLVAYPGGKKETTITLPATIKTVLPYVFYWCSLDCRHLVLTGVETFYAPLGGQFEDITITSSFKNFVPSENSGYPGTGNSHKAFTKWIISGANANFSVESSSGALFDKNFTKLISFPNNKTGSYTIPSTTKTIGIGAFAYSQLTTVNIPESVEEIQRLAFSWHGPDAGASAGLITNINFAPNSKLKKIGTYAFHYNHAITSITIPASVDSLGGGAFFHAINLQTVNIETGSKLTSIGNHAFYECSSLSSISFNTNAASSLTIGVRAFEHCSNLPSFTFPVNVTKIDESAFVDCSSLSAITFESPSRLDTIGLAAFQNCGLTSVDIPESVRCIGNRAFNSCQQLQTVHIPAATTSLGAQAFLFCGQLTDIKVHEDNPSYADVDGMLTSKNKKTLLAFPAGKANTFYTMLSPSIETIGDSAFYYIRNLQTVTLPKRVSKIGKYTFALCQNLQRVNFLANDPIAVADIDPTAFHDFEQESKFARGEINIVVRAGKRDEYLANDFWKNAGTIKEAFIKDDVEYFPLSDTDVDVVDVQADVTTLVVPETVVGNDSKTYNVKLFGDFALEDSRTNVEEVVIFNQLTYVGANAFIKSNTTLEPVKNVFFVSSLPAPYLATSHFGIGTEYKEAGTDQMIYVKKRAEADYEAAWPSLASQIDHKIPGISLTNTYGTFAREFDVDLADYFAENGSGRVFAFTTAPDKTFYEGSGDGNVPGTWYIRMYSINEGLNGDGTYIPAGTGVMLKSMGGAATPSEFYYTIGDSTTVNTDIAGAVLVGVTVKPTTVEDPNKDIYVMSGGVFKPLNGKTVASFPVHKAYLQLPSTSYPGAVAGAKLSFTFFDHYSGEVTTVDNLDFEGSETGVDDGSIYDLQGRRVSAAQKGVYIKNGKKIIVK